MRRELWWATAVILLAGCGGSSSDPASCDTFTKGLNDYNAKVAPCVGSTVPFQQSACTNALSNSSCSSADKQKFADFGSCLSTVPTCTDPNFSTAVSTCTTKLTGLSTGCGGG